MTSQEKKSSFQYIDEINNDDGIIVANYKSISKNDVGSTVNIKVGDNGSKKKKTKQMTL